MIYVIKINVLRTEILKYIKLGRPGPGQCSAVEEIVLERAKDAKKANLDLKNIVHFKQDGAELKDRLMKVTNSVWGTEFPLQLHFLVSTFHNPRTCAKQEPNVHS